jgi:hypothetical protein
MKSIAKLAVSLAFTVIGMNAAHATPAPNIYRCIDLNPANTSGVTLRDLVVNLVDVEGGTAYGDFVLDGKVLGKHTFYFQVGPEVIQPNMAIWVTDSAKVLHPIYCLRN